MVNNHGSHNMTVLYPNLCYNGMCYKGTAMYHETVDKFRLFYRCEKLYIPHV